MRVIIYFLFVFKGRWKGTKGFANGKKAGRSIFSRRPLYAVL